MVKLCSVLSQPLYAGLPGCHSGLYIGIHVVVVSVDVAQPALCSPLLLTLMLCEALRVGWWTLGVV